MLPPVHKNIPWLPKKKMDLRDEQWDVNGIGELQVQFWHHMGIWQGTKVVILLADPQMQSRNTLGKIKTHDKTVKNDAKAFNEGSISKTILGRCACATLFGLLSPNVRISIGGTRSWCEWGMFACTITHCLPGLVDRTISAKRPIPLVVGVEPPENWDWNWFRFVQERSVITPKNRYPQWLQPNLQHASGHVVLCPVPCLHKVSTRCWALATGATWAGSLSCGKTWTVLLLSVASRQPGTWWNVWHVESWTYWHLTWWVVVCGTCYMWNPLTSGLSDEGHMGAPSCSQ